VALHPGYNRTWHWCGHSCLTCQILSSWYWG